MTELRVEEPHVKYILDAEVPIVGITAAGQNNFARLKEIIHDIRIEICSGQAISDTTIG